MTNDHSPIFSIINLLSLVAAIAGTVFLLLGTDSQLIGGWLLLIGAEVIFWLMLEREIKITRYFGLLSSLILVAIALYVVIGDWTMIFSRYDILLLLVYLPFRVLYLVVTPGELTFPILMSSILTVFAGIMLVYIDGSELIWFAVMALFIVGEFLYFWKRNNKLAYQRLIGAFSFGFIFIILLLVFLPLDNTPEFRLDLFLILIYTPFRFFESALSEGSTKYRTIAFQLSYYLLGFGLFIYSITLEILLALETLGVSIPSFNDKTWSWLEYVNSLLRVPPLLEFGGNLQEIFHFLEISLLLLGGLGIIIICEIGFIYMLVVSSFFKKREFTRDSTYFKLHAIVWYLGILVASIGYYISTFILQEHSNFSEAANWIKLISILLAVYLVLKLLMNCAITTFWGPITATLISQICIIASILIAYFLTEPIVIENIKLEIFILGISLGIIGIIFLLIATYTIAERFKSLLLYLWVGWSAIELVVAILGLVQENDELILVAVPLTIISLVITIISSKGKWWMTRTEVKWESPPPQPPPSSLDTELESLKSTRDPKTPSHLTSPPPVTGPPPAEKDPDLSEKRKKREEMEKKLLKAIEDF